MAIIYSQHGTIVRSSGGGYVVHEVEIGTQTWSDRNLDLTFDGLQFNISTTDAVPAAFYNSDAYKKGYGLLYNWYAIKYINDNRSRLIPGWHIATETEYNTLIDYVGGTGLAYNRLRSILWNNGADSYLFSLLPCGYGNPSSSPKCQQVNNEINLGTITEPNTNAYRVCCVTNNGYLNWYNHPKPLGTALRLVKDAT